MGSGHLRDGDVGRLLQVIDEGFRDDPGEAIPWMVLDGLQRLVPCDLAISFADFDYVEGRNSLYQGLEDGVRFVDRVAEEADGDPGPVFRALFWDSYCSYPQRSGDLTSVISDSDFFASARARRSSPMQAWQKEECGHLHCMIVSFPAEPGRARRLLFQRQEGRPFTERDSQVLALLRPHLYEIWLHAERQRSGMPQLTAREWEVLHLSAAGRSNREIAAQLVLSVATVRKHMEHIRQRLGVHSRAAAAASALPHLSLAPPLAGSPRT